MDNSRAFARICVIVVCLLGWMAVVPAGTALAEAQAQVNACGTIASNTAWSSSNQYVANNCNVVVNAGVTLTIPAGTIVKFDGVASAFIINGNLVVTGSPGSEVVLTSYQDDLHGGDTNSNGASNGTAGDWYGLHFAPGSSGNIQYAYVGFAASDAWNAVAGWNVGSIRVNGAAFTMTNSQVANGKTAGIYFEGSGSSPVLDHVTVTQHNSGDVNDPAPGIYQYTINMNTQFTNLAMTGNDVNSIVIHWDYGRQISQNVTLGNAGVPYTFRCGYTNCLQEILAGYQLKLKAGTTLEMPNYKFALVVYAGATLNLEGTAQDPVTIKGVGSGRENGLWQKIIFHEGSSGTFSYCDISQAGGYYNNLSALEVMTSNLTVTNCRIHNNTYDGIDIHGPTTNITPMFQDVEVDTNGRFGYTIGSGYQHPASPTIQGGSIHHNSSSGFLINQYIGTSQPVIRDLEISSNTGDGITIQWNGVRPLIEGVTIQNNTGYAIRMHPDSSPTVRDVTLAGNLADAVIIEGGTIYGGRSWSFGEGVQARLIANLWINGAGLLSLPAGTTIYMGPNIAIINAGSLYLMGTAQDPIRFLPLPGGRAGNWAHIYITPDGKAILQHCELAYGGSDPNYGMLDSYSYYMVIVQNCKIHHSSKYGVWIRYPGPFVHNNDIYDNATYGLISSASGVDVTQNWWGDPSGPYNPLTNPTGKGNAVGWDMNAIFNPWLNGPASETSGFQDFILEVSGQDRFFPGQAKEYAIQYANLLTETITNTVIVVQLPNGAEYMNSTGGGIYYPSLHQVFWKLGNLAPGASGLLAVQVQYRWGLARDFQDGIMAFILSDTYNQPTLDLDTYLNYDPVTSSGEHMLSQVEFDAIKAGDAALKAYYDAAFSQGYAFQAGFQQTLTGRSTLTSAAMAKLSTRSVRLIYSDGSDALQMTFENDTAKIEDAEGWMTTNISTGYQEFGGVMAEPLRDESADCTYGRCLRNCLGKLASWNYIGGKAAKTVGWLLSGFVAPPVAFAGTVYEIGSTAFDVVGCKYECEDPETHCCTAGQVRWENSFSAKITNNCMYSTCNPTTQTWDVSRYKTCIAYGERCVPGIRTNGETGCVACNEILQRAAEVCSAVGKGGKPSCKSLENQQAHDPNELAGPEGDLIPGQWITYTISYENTGAGTAYGVYITDILPDALDFDSVVMTGPGQLTVPGSRMLVWQIGEVPGTGLPGASGEVSFKVQVKSGLPGGTVITNQATVYFPSVPEETPTNSIVNTIQPVAAHPQMVETQAGTPKLITLTGSEVSGLPLTFSVTQPPEHGTLTGTPPNVTYTPASGFTGGDAFWFSADNVTRSPSRLAQVLITVLPDPAETTPPTVLWTSPADDAVAVPVAREILFEIDGQPVYLPGIVIGFSEGMDETTLTASNLVLQKSGGGTVPLYVVYDPALYQVTLFPTQALLGERIYTVQVTQSVTDLAGNPLAAVYSFSFTTGAIPPVKVYLPLVVR